MNVASSNSTYSVMDNAYGIVSDAWHLMPWNLPTPGVFCPAALAIVGGIREGAHLLGIPHFIDASTNKDFSPALLEAQRIRKLIVSVGLGIGGLEALVNGVCYGNSISEKLEVMGRSFAWNVFRTTIKVCKTVPTTFSWAIPEAVLTVLRLRDGQHTHYMYAVHSQDSGSVDLYARFQKAIESQDPDTVRLLIERYKQAHPGEHIKFTTPTGDLDGLFLAVTAQKLCLEIIQMLMQTGCNPNSENNGKTPLEILKERVKENPTNEMMHVLLYMSGIISLSDQLNNQQSAGRIAGESSNSPLAIGDNSKVCTDPDGCIEDGPQE